jgi:hypothetical protein
MRKIMILVLVLTGLVYSSEMPIGVYDNGDSHARLLRDISLIKDSLGANFIYGSFDTVVVNRFSEAGYDIIKWGSSDQNNPNIMSAYSYFKVQAEDASSAIKFETRLGTQTGGFLVYSGQDTMLNNLEFCQYPKMHFLDDDCESPKQFYSKIRMAIPPMSVPVGTLLGRILVNREDSSGFWTLKGAIDILATQELRDGDTVEVPDNPPYFTLCNSDTCAWANNVKYSFWSSGVTTVYLDYLKAYEEMGQKIVETTDYDDSIAAAVTGGWRDAVDYWWL